MGIQTGQRTTENSSDTKKAEAAKRSAASKKAAATRKRNAKKSSSLRASAPTVAKKDQGKAIELADNPFTDEKVEIYGRLEADVERRENRSPAADPIKTVTVGKDGVFKVEGLKRGSYLAYGPDSQTWLGIQSV